MAIRYNLLNLPDTIQFMNGNQIVNVYDAAGRKLYSKTYTFLQQLAQPVTQVLQLEPAPRHIEQITTVYNGNVTSTNRFGELAGYGTPQMHTIYNTEGYVMRQIYLWSYRQEYDYYYYRRDHLGNNVAVWNATEDSTVQRTFYYASGLPMSCSTGQSAQSRKYNGKEYVEDHGFDVYDYGFRGYYATIGRFTSIDPLAEQTPWQSPYVYANNNFINNVDLWGLAATGSIAGFHNDFSIPILNWVAIDDNGNVVGWGDDDDDNHVYLVDEYWDGTYAGLGGYEMIGWEIPVGENGRTGILGYQKGQPCYYLGSSAHTYIGANGWTIIGAFRLMYGNKPVTTTIDNTFQAIKHYYDGNGEPIALGTKWTSQMFGKQLPNHKLLTSTIGTITVDMTCGVFHIGNTKIAYQKGATYDIFACGLYDGFWDPNFILEDLFGVPTDNKGPMLEFGGTPYDYIPLIIF